jgi:hypothetical protein
MDFAWRHPRGESSRRQLRDRQRDLAELVDRAGHAPTSGTARRLVKIYDGGSIPTGQSDKFYLTNPAEVDGSETEGGSYTPSPDTAQTIPVVILGTAAMAGDLVVAHAIGGRWFGERRHTGIALTTCGSCSIPLADLTLTTSGTGTFGGGCFNLNLTLIKGGGADPFSEWSTAEGQFTCGSHFYYYWTLNCITNVPTLRFYQGASSGGETLAYSSNAADHVSTMTTDSQTCGDPFSWTMHFCSGNNCAIGEWIWTVTYP